MAVYIPKFDGYIADNPNIDFERCDNTVFSYYEVNTASMSNTSNSLAITGGQGNYPLAYIDTDKTLEFTFASSQFNLDIFAMANATTIEDGDFGIMESHLYDVENGLTITIPYETKPNSVRVPGLAQAQTAASGKFSVTVTAATADTAGSTLVTLYEGDATVGDTVRVAYIRRIVDSSKVSVTTKATTAKGSLYAHWPVYGAGDSCADASVKGWLHLYIPRCRVTALPGFDNSLTTLQAA